MQAARANKQTNWVSQTASPMCLFALVLCLLLSQALGFMHGIEHAPHTHQHNTQFDATVFEVRPSWVADLFAGHSEESTCQVFDQLSHGSALLGHAVDIAQLALSSFFLDFYRDATPAHQHSLVQARGPPTFLDFTVIL